MKYDVKNSCVCFVLPEIDGKALHLASTLHVGSEAFPSKDLSVLTDYIAQSV